MSTLNVRLPEDLENLLAREAELAHKPRSELAREAIRTYLEQLERERHLSQFLAEAREVYSDEGLRQDAREVAEDLGPFEAEPPDEPGDSQDEASGNDWWR
ncbi:MAG TPA: ribbon-helix-helix protein, CopG family [Gammaproteobacteria bacterium]|nr:ribbon-helix-helix protein, CopG family [Gammaproteobacteria bacterium]